MFRDKSLRARNNSGRHVGHVPWANQPCEGDSRGPHAPIADGARVPPDLIAYSCFKNSMIACWSVALRDRKRRMTSRASLRFRREVSLSYGGQMSFGPE